MLACSITRAAGMYYHGALDYPWQVYWLHSEACIGIIMGSITAYRSTLIGSNEVSDKVQSYFNKLLRRRTSSATPAHDAEEAGKKNQSLPRHLLLRIPSATLSGLRTMFRDPLRTHATSASVSTQNSNHGLLETDYHAYIKKVQAEPGEARSWIDDPTGA